MEGNFGNKTFKDKFPNQDNDLIELEEKMQEEVVQELKKEIKEIDKELKDGQLKRIEEINKDFENPIGDLIIKEETID